MGISYYHQRIITVYMEFLTVCINYGDFLAETVKWNIDHCDRWIIVTSPEDLITQEVCRKYNLEMIISEDHKKYGDTFNKGRLIERGLQHLSADGWRCHIDADIVLPYHFKRLLRAADLQEDKIYGCDRIMIQSYDEWVKFQSLNWFLHDYQNRVVIPKGYQIGTRWCHIEGGYTPIGFWQCWHSSNDHFRGTRIRPYPTRHNDACRSDVQFSMKFDRCKRELLPELVVVHLESEPAKLGANWAGRKTRIFNPSNIGLTSECVSTS